MSSSNLAAVKPANKKRNGRKRIMIVLALVAIAAGIVVLSLPKTSGKSATLYLADTGVLSYTDMQSSISATGIVESANSKMVYSTLSYPIMEVLVEVGDTVNEGQLLAQLDSGSIENQLKSQQTSLEVSQQSSSAQVQSAQDTFDNFQAGLNQGLNTTILTAQAQVQTTYESYLKAQTNYERYLASIDAGENQTILTAKNSLLAAERALESAEDAYDDLADSYADARSARKEAKDLLAEANETLEALYQTKEELTAALEQAEEGSDTASLEQSLAQTVSSIEAQTAAVTQLEQQYAKADSTCDTISSNLSKAETQVASAQDSYELAKASYNASLTTVDNTLEDYDTAVQSTWDAYQRALTNLESAKKNAQDQLETYSNTLNSAQIGSSTAVAEETIRQTQENLADTQITAPCAGTITAVYAKVGNVGSGLLFVIEDIDNLVVETSVKGYDMGSVSTGMKVLLESDATGDEKLQGVISTIAPTARKTSLGTTDTSNESIFDAEVTVLSKNPALRIGMEVHLDYIIAEQAHVLCVPYDAVYQNADGENCILIALPQEKDQYLLQELPVQVGIDNDLDIVVSGPGVEEGLRVVYTPESYTTWIGQTLHATTASRLSFGG